MHTVRRPLLLAVTGAIFILLALFLALGGLWLIFLGGSWFYLPAGLLLGASGWLISRADVRGLWLYTLFFVLTLIWSLWEAGLDWWPLAARLDIPFLLGLWLLTPWVRRAFVHARTLVAPAVPVGQPSADPLVPDAPVAPAPVVHDGPGLVLARAPLAVALLAFAGVAVASWFTDPNAIAGRLPPQRSAATDQDAGAPAVPPGEWHAYGRTGFGQRYSPLTQINPQNVSNLKEVWRYQTGDVRGRPGDPEETTFQATPLKVGNRLFLCTPHQSVIALEATTGRELWRYNPLVQGDLALQHLTCRGLSYHDGRGAAPDATPVSLSTAAAPAPTEAADGAPPATAQAQDGPAPSGPDATATVAAGQPAGATPSAQAQDADSVDGNRTAEGERVAPTNAAPGTGALASGPATAFTQPGQPIAAEDAHPTNAACTAMLFMPTADGRVIALNPEDGAVCTNFGQGTGQINLWANMPFIKPGSAYSTSPVVVTRDRLVVAGTVLDNVSTSEPSGVVRGYDVRTGELVWNWDSGNPNDTAPITGDRTYLPNSPNSWSISSVDEALGMVYVPMGNQPPDQWGGNRSPEAETYSSAVVALDLATGEPRWHYQTVHHDLWDYDVPAQPSLVDLTIDGEVIPALVQPTKQGELFVLDRRNGQPVLPVREEPVPQGAAAGDFTAPTQPRSALSFDPPPLTGASMWGATMFDQLQCRIAFHRLRYEGRYTPPSEQGTLVYPGNFGTFNWGGVAIDPQRQIVFATPTRLAFVSQLVPREDDETLHVQGDERPEYSLPALNENFGAPFAVKLHPFMSALGLPCQAPPWGLIAGADLTTGDVAWMHRNGTVRDASPLPLPFKMGVPNLGGPIMTAGGVAFLTSTIDYYIRAYDVSTGQQLWQERLPAGGQATPMTFVGDDGRQYVVAVAGGHGSLGTKAGDYVIAYAVD